MMYLSLLTTTKYSYKINLPKINYDKIKLNKVVPAAFAGINILKNILEGFKQKGTRHG